MTTKAAAASRRVFLKQSSALGVMGLLWGTGLAAEPDPGGKMKKGKRIRLPEAGPMIPPVPAILLTVNGKPGGPDEISVVWTFVVEGKPPQIGISVHKQHVANELIKTHGEFVLNLPVADMVTAFDKVDMSSGRVGDKFKLSGLTRGKAVAVNAPTVEESPIHVECKVFNTIQVPPARTLFLAEVSTTTVHEGVCDEKGRLMVNNVPFFGMTAGSGEFYTMGKRVGNIGMTKNRTDIKY
ncbi:MAG: flavin reductase family protein [bacterium]|nr:flavin reductase family protein [bacterium]